MPKLTVQLTNGTVSAVIQVPVRPDGASPHAIEEVVAACVSGLWGAIDVDEACEADADGGDE